MSTNLSSEISFPYIFAKNRAFYDFAKEYMDGNLIFEKYGQYVFNFPLRENSNKINLKIVGLNSSLFCGYDGDDKEKLALGMEQITKCESLVKSEDVVISCIHHPFNCFHPCEKTSLNILKRFSDIILYGHVHEQHNSAYDDGNSGKTIFINSGAAYESRESQNGFNIIKLDIETLEGFVTFYKYLSDQHIWTINKDINIQDDGMFKFKLDKKLNTESNTNSYNNDFKNTPTKTAKYMLVLDLTFDELNRSRVDAIVNHLKGVTNDSNISITKMEQGSVKIFFETSKDVSKITRDNLKKIDGLEIIEIKEIDDEIHLKSNKLDKSVFHWRTYLKPEFSENIENPGATFTHSRVDELKLKDLYVHTNLKIIKPEENKEKRFPKIVSSADVLVKKVGVSLKVIIYGADNSGKSTLVKWWYDNYYENGFIPILINSIDIKDISVEKINKLVKRELLKQYDGLLEGNLEDYENDRIILITDDFHKIRFTQDRFKSNVISNLNKTYQNIIITADDFFYFEAYTKKTEIIRNIVENFRRYQIMEFGPKLRFELIKKWNGLGSEQLEPNELIRLNNDTESHIESIIGKNFVPSYPLYLLTILQAREASSILKPEFSLHGFYYELLINDALNNAILNKGDISLYYNFITEYSYYLFDHKIRQKPFFIEDFKKFHIQYCKDYKVDISYEKVIETLVNSKLLRRNDNYISISYKYVYYFFVAKYLANHISSDKIKDKIKLLSQRLHREEFSSIIMFLTHLSKDQFIINQLLEHSKNMFVDFEPCKLDEDVSFINDLIKKLPQQIYEPLDIEVIKEEGLKEEEELDMQEKEFDTTKIVYEYDIDEDISSLDIISRITRALKTIEILGQVTKKYWGELKAQQKYDLAEETYMLGLRSLNFYFSMINNDPNDLINYLNKIYRRKHLNKNLSKKEIEKASVNFLFGLCVMSSYGLVKRVTNAIGYDKLSGTFKDILKNYEFNSIKLIDTSIKLDHNKKFPWKEIKSLQTNTKDNFLSNIVLQNLVINYLYMFHTSIEEKQKICSLLGIKIDNQRLIDITSTVKKEV